MTYPIFKGKGSTTIDKLDECMPQPQDYSIFNKPEDYQCSEELADTVNVALLMNQPTFALDQKFRFLAYPHSLHSWF